MQPVRSPAEASQAFDEITYQKGQAVIRMLEAYLGAEGFREGIRRYLRAHAYGNATTADLWAQLAAASGQPVAPVATSFTDQPGVLLLLLALIALKVAIWRQYVSLDWLTNRPPANPQTPVESRP